MRLRAIGYDDYFIGDGDPDNAFVSIEGVGSEPGTVEMIDLRSHKRIASVDVGQMAGGIDILGK